MEYYFDELDPSTFQRLINGILVARFGEGIRLTPLHGKDGGRDAETAPGNQFFIHINDGTQLKGIVSSPQKGRYIFQVKHHRLVDASSTDVRRKVIADFEKEMKNNVLSRVGDERVDYFFLITNVPSSRDALADLDKKRLDLLKNEPHLHADVWWKEQVIAWLDQMPSLWNNYPQIFAGGKVPFMAGVARKPTKGLPRAIRTAIETQYRNDSKVKFSQIKLDNSLSKLFVDLDIGIHYLSDDERQQVTTALYEQKHVVTPKNWTAGEVKASVSTRTKKGVHDETATNIYSRIQNTGGA